MRSKGGDTDYLHFQSASARLLPKLIAGRSRGPLFLAERWPVPGRWLCTARPQGVLTAEERDAVLKRRRHDAAELARRQRRTSRLGRVRLAPITTAGPIEEVTVIARDQASQANSHLDDEHLWRLARTDLLGLEVRAD